MKTQLKTICNMKTLLPFILFLFAASLNAQIVDIPNPNFKNWLLSASATNQANQIAQDFSDNWVEIDTNNDGEIQVAEAQAIKLLSVGGFSNNPNLFNSIIGITSFSNLETLSVSDVNLLALDLSGINNLKSFSLVNCFSPINLNINSLVNLEFLNLIAINFSTPLNINNLTSLKRLAIVETNLSSLNLNAPATLTRLDCFSNNELTSLNLTGYGALTHIRCFFNALSSLTLIGVNNLEELDCSGNQLTSLNGISPTIKKLRCAQNLLTSFNPNPLVNLTDLDCSANKINTLNVSNLDNLINLSCASNEFTSISINNLANLVSISCGGNNQLTTATFTNLPNLENLEISGTINLNGVITSQLSSLTINNVPSLKNLYCNYGFLTNLNLSGLTNLEVLECSFNQLESLNLTNLPNLKLLNCSFNQITTLDASQLPSLINLNCGKGYIVDGQLIPKLVSLNVAGLANLKSLDCSINFLSSLNLTGLNSLETLYCGGSGSNTVSNITSLNVNTLTNLKSIDCRFMQLTSLDVSNLQNLTDLYCSYNQISNLNLNGLLNLKYLDYSYNALSNLSLVNLPSLESLSCSYNQLTTLDVLNLTNLKSLVCSNNQLTSLNLSGLNSLTLLDFSSNELSLANITGLSSNLTSLNCGNNNLITLDVSSFPNLISLGCFSNQLTSLDVSMLPSLNYLDANQNLLTNIDLSNNLNLQTLNIYNNQLVQLNTSGLPNLVLLYCSNNQLTSLDLSNNSLLMNLDYSYNNLPNLNIANLSKLNLLACTSTQTSQLNLENFEDLRYLSCDINNLQTLDLSNQTKLRTVTCTENLLLTSIFIKNGAIEDSFSFGNNPLLQYICADDDQLEFIQTQLNAMGMTGTVCNSYCTFSPGGNFNTIGGTTIFDDNNNGCEITDEVNPFIRLNITDGVETGATVTSISGSYTFFTNVGNYTISPNVENPTWFSFSPANANFTFTDNNNVATQDFCITAVGVHNDVEVVFAQLEPARPGFDATYKLVYKNKGNQMLSGTVTLNFDDSRTDVLATTPIAATTATNQLTWDYANLMPFESRSILLTLNINSPMETPAVNNGDILIFTSSITPQIIDEQPQDNQFVYEQTVVGSFDPNDITCLEGDTLSPSEIGKYLHYLVRFENTGTFFAENVVVRIEIDETKYDINSLQVLSDSHPSTTKITGNLVEFIFEDIFLEAAAGDPPVGGHGNVLFKIKSKETLEVNDTVTKKANIYFDYNFPIETNEANTTYVLLSNSIIVDDQTITCYPNPTKDVLHINSKYDIKSVQLFDIQGRILETQLVNDLETQLDLSAKAKGIYFIKVTSIFGEKVEKIIKE